jgi:DNA-binding CsgD family transcriptional regulator
MVSDPVFDAFQPKAIAATTEAEVKQILRDANEHIARQQYSISLLQPMQYSLYKRGLRVITVYAVGLPSEARKLLPEWIGVAASLEDVPGKSIVLVDEAYVPYHARAGTTVGAKTMSRDGNLSRQREQTIIFVTQEARQIDKNIASSADVVVFKEVSMLQLKFDRRELNDLATQARAAFATIKGDKRQWSFVCVLDTGFAGLVQNTLPTFWKEKLSHVFAAGGEAIAMAPKKTPLSQRIEKAKELALQGLSQGEIAKLMGVSRPTVGNWLKSYPYKR